MPPTSGTVAADNPAKKYKAFIDAFLPTLSDAKHENRIAYMYLDSNAHLTIGIGHLLAKHQYRNDRKYVQASIQAIFKYGFSNLKVTKAPVHGRKENAVKPGPKGMPSPPPAPAFSWEGLTHAAEQWWHDLEALGPRDGSRTFNADPAHMERPVASPLFPGITVEKLTDDALKIMALDIHYLKANGTRHIYGAAHYQSYNRYGLTESGLDNLGFDDVLDKINAVKKHAVFKNFDTFPDTARQAVIDLAFQHGDTGLANKTAFASTVEKADWATAASQVPTDSASAERTAWRRKQLRAAEPAGKPAQIAH